MALAGLDIGSGGCKCTIYDHEGHVTSYRFLEYNQEMLGQGCYELDLNIVWQKVVQVASEALKGHHGDPVVAMGISSFGESGVLIDESGTLLSRALMYSDIRGGKQCQEYVRKVGEEVIVEKTGLKPHPMYSLSKILWLKENKPSLFNTASAFLLIADYILYRFTGKKCTDYSLATRTMLFNIQEKKWDAELLSAAGLKETFFATPVQTGTQVGIIIPEIAKLTGFSPNLLLIAAGQDQISTAIGSGAIFTGQAVNGMGSVDCITPVFDKSRLSKAMSRYGFSSIPYLSIDQYVTYAFNFSGGALLRWYRDQLGFQEMKEATEQGCSAFEILEKQTPKEPTGLLVLPHFQGAATPYMDPDSLGAIIGLSINTTKGAIYRALMEGVAFESKINLLAIKQLGIEIEQLIVCGGGSRSPLWLQIKADILDLPIAVTEHEETGTLGAAILAGVASGVYHNIQDGVKKAVRIAKTMVPNKETNRIYEELFVKYQRVYQHIKQIVRG